MSPANLIELGALIARTRRERGLSKEALAALVGVTGSTILRMERGEFGRPDPDKLQRVARALEIDAEDLFALANYTPSDSLPAFGPYLRAKFGEDLPAGVRQDLENYFEKLRAEHGGDER